MLEFVLEKEDKRSDIVANQASLGLGLAPTWGLWEDSEEGFFCKPFPWIM